MLDNPIAAREWRVLRRQAGDWRIWIGAKWTLDPIVWGAPVVLTYALGPYGLRAVLALMGRLGLMPSGGLSFDAFFLLALVFWFYVVAISLVLGAHAVTHEREQQTWDQVRATPLTGQERAAGLLWGRLGPVWASLLVTVGFWWLFQPPDSSSAAASEAGDTWRHGLAMGALLTGCFSALAGEIGLLASSRSVGTPGAVLSAALQFVTLMAGLGFMGPITFVAAFVYSYPGRHLFYLASLGTAVTLWLLVYLCLKFWKQLVDALEN